MTPRQRSEHRQRKRILRLLEDVYVRDMYAKGSREHLSAEFDEVFHMLVPEIDGRTLLPTTLRWDGLEELRSNHPKALSPTARFEFPLIDVIGHAAVARVDVLDGDTPIFSDYVNLYCVEGTWKLVSKVFHAHTDALARQAANG